MKVIIKPRFYIIMIFLFLGLILLHRNKLEISSFFSDPFIIAVTIILGLILGIAGLLGISYILPFLGIVIKTKSSPIRIAVYGLGGVGKTTLLDSMVHGKKERRLRTETIEILKHSRMYHNKTFDIETIDCVGQEEDQFRVDLIEHLKKTKEEVQVLIIMLSFYPIKGRDIKDTELLIPSDENKRNRVINEHCKKQIDHFNQAICQDLICRLYGLRRIYLVFNHMDILFHETFEEKIRFAEKKFSNVTSLIESIIKENELKMGFNYYFVSALRGIEITKDDNPQPSSISILEDILDNYF